MTHSIQVYTWKGNCDNLLVNIETSPSTTPYYIIKANSLFSCYLFLPSTSICTQDSRPPITTSKQVPQPTFFQKSLHPQQSISNSKNKSSALLRRPPKCLQQASTTAGRRSASFAATTLPRRASAAASKQAWILQAVRNSFLTAIAVFYAPSLTPMKYKKLGAVNGCRVVSLMLLEVAKNPE